MNIEEIKKILTKEKEEIEVLLNEITKELENIKDSPEFEATDIAEQFEEKQDLNIKKEVIELRLEKIKKALEKIEKGTYGKCENCGQDIEEERLKIDPASNLCRKCSLK